MSKKIMYVSLGLVLAVVLAYSLAGQAVASMAPQIDIEKHTNGEDADAAPGPYILVGAPVLWEYHVTNTGTVDLVNIEVSDDQLGVIWTGSLPPDAIAIITVEGIAEPGQYENSGTAIGTDADGISVQDSDLSHYLGVVPVAIDVKPGSCPNPLNVKGRGVLQVAILGTEDFDVTQVDPSTVTLEGIAPLRWALEDVATPYTDNADGCWDLGSDGYLDLTLKFNTQEVVAALGDVSDGDVLVLHLTGNLMVEYNGTAIIGEDVVLILKKGADY